MGQEVKRRVERIVGTIGCAYLWSATWIEREHVVSQSTLPHILSKGSTQHCHSQQKEVARTNHTTRS